MEPVWIQVVSAVFYLLFTESLCNWYLSKIFVNEKKPQAINLRLLWPRLMLFQVPTRLADGLGLGSALS
jgi:hypothetical protein